MSGVVVVVVVVVVDLVVDLVADPVVDLDLVLVVAVVVVVVVVADSHCEQGIVEEHQIDWKMFDESSQDDGGHGGVDE